MGGYNRRCSSLSPTCCNWTWTCCCSTPRPPTFELEQPDDDGEDGQGGFRTHGHSKDHRKDLPQVVIGMAVTRGGVPGAAVGVGGQHHDMTVLEEVRGDLGGWRLNRTVWVTDAGFNSTDNRQLLQAGGRGSSSPRSCAATTRRWLRYVAGRAGSATSATGWTGGQGDHRRPGRHRTAVHHVPQP